MMLLPQNGRLHVGPCLTFSNGIMAKGIQSVDIAFNVLETLQRAGRQMPLKDIAAGVGMSASKTRMYLVSLLRVGLVAQTGEAGSYYTLGPAALSLGLAAFNQIDLVSLARALMAGLAKETHAPCMLCMWSGTGITIVARNDSLIDLPIDFRVGGPVPLTRSATGRTFLAYLPASVTHAAMLSEVARPGNTTSSGEPITIDYLNERIQIIRARGYEAADEVILSSNPPISLSGYGALAAPVVDLFHQLRFVLLVLHRKTNDQAEADEVAKILEKIRRSLPVAGPGEPGFPTELLSTAPAP
jgi:DNA-binding IclR family transcriptional regulator